MTFIKTFFLSSVLLFSVLYGYIVAVDPYNKLGINLFGFKTKAVDFPRVNKFNQIEHSQKIYQAFILGSSAAHRYPTKVVKEITGLETYNYAVQSATPEDYLAIFNHVLSRMDPKLIILSVDFYNLNKHFKTDDMFYASPLKDFLTGDVAKESEGGAGIFNKTYLTFQALADSLQVAYVNILGKARHAYVENGDYFTESPNTGAIQINQFHGLPYEFDEKRLSYLREIQSKASSKKIRLVVFTSPVAYNHYLKMEEDLKLKEVLEKYKATLVGIFGEIYDFNNEAIKAFYGPQFFNDSTHPSALLSTLILRRLLLHELPNGVDSRFGQKLTR